MFRRYNITTADDKREALRKQFEFLNAQPKTNVAEFPKAATDENTDTTQANG